ncbi:MFS transporter [Caldimonas brevitalea]|nr:MFS transporter [Caldimonas brevitalea]
MSVAPPPTPSAVLSVRALVMLCVLNHLALTGSRVAVSLSALSLGVPAFQVGLMMALFSLLPTLGAVWLGRWVDRGGPRVPALAGMVALWAGLLLPACHWAPAMLWLTAATAGAGYNALLLAVQAQLGRCRDDAGRARGHSGIGLGTALSGCLGPLVAGQAITHAGGELAFSLLAACSLMAWVGAIVTRRGLSDGADDMHLTAHPARLSVRQVLEARGLRRILLVDLLVGVAWNANTFLVPVFGAHNGWSAAAVGNLLAAYNAAVLLARALPAPWRQRLGDARIIRFALACSGLCFLLFPLAHALPMAFALECVLGIGLGSALPSVLALLHAESPAGRGGEVLGVRLVVLNVSAVVLPIGLGAAVGASLGLATAMAALGAVLSCFAAMQRPAQRPAKSTSQ